MNTTAIKRGHCIVLGVLIFFSSFVLLNFAHSIIKVTSDRHSVQIIRAVTFFLLGFFLYRGHRWARILVGALGFLALFTLNFSKNTFKTSYTSHTNSPVGALCFSEHPAVLDVLPAWRQGFSGTFKFRKIAIKTTIIRNTLCHPKNYRKKSKKESNWPNCSILSTATRPAGWPAP